MVCEGSYGSLCFLSTLRPDVHTPGSSQTQPVWKAYPIIHKPVQYPASEHSPHSPALEDQTCLIVNCHIDSVLAEQIYIFFELQQRGRQRMATRNAMQGLLHRAPPPETIPRLWQHLLRMQNNFVLSSTDNPIH